MGNGPVKRVKVEVHFELVRDFMPVFVIRKFDQISIENKAWDISPIISLWENFSSLKGKQF